MEMIFLNIISQVVIVRKITVRALGARRKMLILSKSALLDRQISLLLWGTEENYKRLLRINVVTNEIQTRHLPDTC
jgi:hypothetical protein